MSWHNHIYASNSADLLAALGRVVIDETTAGTEQNDAMREQLDSMKTLVEGVIRTAAVQLPSSNHVFSLHIGGHANAGHAQREGWANDMVTMTLSVNERPAAPTENTMSTFMPAPSDDDQAEDFGVQETPVEETPANEPAPAAEPAPPADEEPEVALPESVHVSDLAAPENN